jgi:hypothetical protein
MQQYSLTPREKKVARRNAILFCGIATIFAVSAGIVATMFING